MSLSAKPLNGVVIGVDGLLGQALRQAALQSGGVCQGTSRRQHSLSDQVVHCDFTEPRHFAALPWQQWQKQAQYVLIPAALTGLINCQQNPQLSQQINFKAPLELGKYALEHGLSPVFFSSDNVFDGQRGDYSETSPLSPVNTYGEHKAQLEKGALALSDQSLVLRLVKIYPGASQYLPQAAYPQFHQRGLIQEILNNLKQGNTVKAAWDQIFNPLWLDDALNGIARLLSQKHRGLINLGGPQVLSRENLARQMAHGLAQQQGLPTAELQAQIEAIQLHELVGQTLPRPLNVSLNTERFQRLTGLTCKTPEQSIQALLRLSS